MLETRVRIGTAGSSYRLLTARALGLDAGDEVGLVLEKDELRLMTQQAAIRQAQELVRRYVPRDRSLVQELIRERCAQAVQPSIPRKECRT